MVEMTRGLTRDQRRQVCAYKAVRQPDSSRGESAGVSDTVFQDFKILVNDLGAHILRGGLSAALAFMARDKSREAWERFLCVLADVDLPHLSGVPARELPERIRTLPVARYMLVTREVLALSVWLRRAVQAREATERATRGGGDAETH